MNLVAEAHRLVSTAMKVTHGKTPDRIDVEVKGSQARCVAHLGSSRQRYVVQATITPVDSTWHDETGRAILNEDR